MEGSQHGYSTHRERGSQDGACVGVLSANSDEPS